MLTVLLVCSVIPSAYAFPGFDNCNFLQDLRRVSQSFVEAIIIDPQQKQELITRNLAEWQAEKEQMISQGIPVPKQYDDVINAKQMAIQRTESESNSPLSDVIDAVLIGQELGKIRSYVEEFHKLKTDDISIIDKSSRANDLERQVNQLNLVKKHCTPISVNVLLSVQEPYDSLTNDYCQILNTIPKPVVLSAIGE